MRSVKKLVRNTNDELLHVIQSHLMLKGRVRITLSRSVRTIEPSPLYGDALMHTSLALRVAALGVHLPGRFLHVLFRLIPVLDPAPVELRRGPVAFSRSGDGAEALRGVARLFGQLIFVDEATLLFAVLCIKTSLYWLWPSSLIKHVGSCEAESPPTSVMMILPFSWIVLLLTMLTMATPKLHRMPKEMQKPIPLSIAMMYLRGSPKQVQSHRGFFRSWSALGLPSSDPCAGSTHTGVTVDTSGLFLTVIRVLLDIIEATCVPGHWENRTAKVT
ncbi:hypothetical protein EYF80_002803 [Liparis tanakae]|uniref:Uncharacterized protein n=1 Tax=Liparis tanakae TaxID=230148 RepID=A0A4Z2JBN1_9TELE|nr:hypothetical protein EYF80_002803 [Liparis tanakae]